MADLRRLRSDLGYFAHEVGADLVSWQAADLALDKPITALLWGRQLGKSRALAVAALHAAYAAPERLVLIVSGGGELGARRLLSEVRSLVATELLNGSRVDESASVVVLTNASEVRCVAGSEASIRGWRVHRLLADEAQLLTDDQWSAALPTLAAAEDGRAVLAGTASAASGPFYDLVRRGETGDEHVHASRRVSRLVGGSDPAPWQSPSMLEAQMATMSDARANAEHRCQWQSESDALFPRSVVERATADYALTPMAELRGPARLTGGIDWGARRNRSTLVALGRLPIAGETRFAVACAQRWPAGYAMHEVVAEIAGSRAHWHRLTSERNGLGEPLSEALERRFAERPRNAGGGLPRRPVIVHPRDLDKLLRANTRRREHDLRTGGGEFRTRLIALHTSSAQKAATYSALRWLLDREQLLLPASGTELIRELLTLRLDLLPGGSERIGAESGANDDLADAVAIALGPWRDDEGTWRTVIGDLADPRARLPEAVAPLTGATVATPSGVVVPRLPTWQSVRGAETTRPRAAAVSPLSKQAQAAFAAIDRAVEAAQKQED